jgi:anti-sigma B factor antagonist
MVAALGIAERRRGHVTVVELTGRLVADDGDTSFTNRITSLVASGSLDLVVNFERVTYIDSGGIGALVSMYLHIVWRGGRLKLLRPSDRVRRVLNMTRLVEVFEIFNDEAAAVRSFAQPTAVPAMVRRFAPGR